MSIIQPVKDRPSVTPDGISLIKHIAGLNIRFQLPLEDKRGEITEILSAEWAYHEKPVVYVYQTTLRPGAVRGWVLHKLQDDRIFTSKGVMRWAFYDDRPDSETYQLLNVFTFSERKRALFTIPKGVYHGVENIGTDEAVFINMPTEPYNHNDPDKYRLPLKNDLIPFAFDDGAGY